MSELSWAELACLRGTGFYPFLLGALVLGTLPLTDREGSAGYPNPQALLAP